MDKTTFRKLRATEMRVSRTTGSVRGAITEFEIGECRGMKIFASVAIGQHTYKAENKERYDAIATPKQMKDWTYYIYGADINDPKHTGWTMCDVYLYAYANGVEIGEPLKIEFLEIGASPSANLIDTGSVGKFTTQDTIENALDQLGEGAYFDWVNAKAVEALNLGSEIVRSITL